MAKKDELFIEMYDFCMVNGCWGAQMTVRQWNECIEASYSSASFTALVNDGRLERSKGYKATYYNYNIALTETIKEKIEEAKKEREIKEAEYTIAHYEEQLEKHKAFYEELIKEAEKRYQRDLEREAEDLEKAKAVLKNAMNKSETE